MLRSNYNSPRISVWRPRYQSLTSSAGGASAKLTEMKAVTAEAIAFTEKKMDMTLDDVIKLTKKNTSKGKGPPRVPIKSQGFINRIGSTSNSKLQHLMDSRSSIRQGVLAHRRSNYQGKQFSLAIDVAKKAVHTRVHKIAINWNNQRLAGRPFQSKAADAAVNGKDKLVLKQKPQTLDALFANMKEQRMRVIQGNSLQIAQRRCVPWQQQGKVGLVGRRFGGYRK